MSGRVASLVAGALFGAGLIISGMTDPARVVGFLDLAGRWDPSLAFVMVGAIVVHFTLFRVIKGRKAPLFEERFHLPTRRDIDLRLVVGAALFGVGWGMGGFCPGPALVSAAAGVFPALVFVAAMTAGMFLERATAAKLSQLEVFQWKSRRSTIRPPSL